VDRTSVKIVVAGGFGTGKTTMVGSVSEIAPLTTEEILTQESVGVDDTIGVEGKVQTTVALDFGRITISDDVVLYLYGTPGQDRYWFMWDALAQGAVGAIVLVDTRRLETSFAAVDYFERRGIPFVAAINLFFREKAFWQFARGSRLGDLRRLIRQYQRPQEAVFPVGTFHKENQPYGTDVNLPVTDNETTNPNFKGCIDRKA